MKISFSTLGCPNWMWGEIISVAKDLSFDGIELRGLGSDLFIPQAKMFSPERLSSTRDDIKNNNLEISCISTECKLYKSDFADVEKIRSYIDLASALGVKYIRLLGDKAPNPGDVDVDIVYETLKMLIPYAEENDIILLVETNGVFADTSILRSLITRLDSPFVKVLWDINHPVRYFGETPDVTWRNIGEFVRHVHLKDSVSENGEISYKMLGYGTLPLHDALKILKREGYCGHLSLEWTKRWNSELEDAGIVFSHFAYMAKKLWNEA